MAVSQVEMLKNPCKVTTWNNFVASQPPSSAPATPITHVMTRPCDLLPGISRLASRPAPRPRTIHATIPITGLLYRDKADGRSGAGSRPGGLAPPWLRDTSPSYFSVTLQSTGQSRRRKEPETANAITQTDHPPTARIPASWRERSGDRLEVSPEFRHRFLLPGLVADAYFLDESISADCIGCDVGPHDPAGPAGSTRCVPSAGGSGPWPRAAR